MKNYIVAIVLASAGLTAFAADKVVAPAVAPAAAAATVAPAVVPAKTEPAKKVKKAKHTKSGKPAAAKTPEVAPAK